MPMSDLDLGLIGNCQVGVLVVLHDLNLAAQYADHILLLKEGREVASGPPEQVLKAEVIEAVYDVPVTVIPHPHGPRPLVVPALTCFL